jgi:hypothetical protein
MSNLYKLNWTVVKSHAQVHEDEEDEPPFASVELSDTTQTLIAVLFVCHRNGTLRVSSTLRIYL